jgi:hypothetical protein
MRASEERQLGSTTLLHYSCRFKYHQFKYRKGATGLRLWPLYPIRRAPDVPEG